MGIGHEYLGGDALVPGRARRVAIGAAVITMALLLALLAWRQATEEPKDAGPQASEPTRIRVTIEPTLVAGSSFSVTFTALDPTLDTTKIRPDITMALWRGNTKLHWLLSVGNPKVIPPDDNPIVPSPLLLGPGPYTFELPASLAPGRYTLCSYVGEQTASNSTTPQAPGEPFCREVEVRAKA